MLLLSLPSFAPLVSLPVRILSTLLILSTFLSILASILRILLLSTAIFCRARRRWLRTPEYPCNCVRKILPRTSTDSLSASDFELGSVGADSWVFGAPNGEVDGAGVEFTGWPNAGMLNAFGVTFRLNGFDELVCPKAEVACPNPDVEPVCPNADGVEVDVLPKTVPFVPFV